MKTKWRQKRQKKEEKMKEKTEMKGAKIDSHSKAKNR